MHMNHNFIKIYFPCIFLAVIGLNSTCLAQSEEEMQLLRMFYKDKDLVVSSTRTPKSISQVAENITIITSEDIEAMNAHTIADVLGTVQGIFISSNQDFGASSIIGIQGSEDRHVLVLVDEVPWNFLSGGNAETNTVPIGAVDRIEIIKGPASSAWGSSLGGVINIITKETGKSEKPAGTIRGSYSKGASQDYRVEISGKAGSMGYCLYAGDQESDGLVSSISNSRYFNNQSFYTKLDLNVSEKTELGLTAGYSSPDTGFGDFPANNASSTGKERSFFATAYLKTSISKDLDLKLSVYNLKSNFSIDLKMLGLEPFIPDGTLTERNSSNEKTSGARGQLVWENGSSTAVFGMEYDSSNMMNTLIFSPVMQDLSGVPAELKFDSDIRQWALYANQSLGIGKWSVTPGIRYDYNDISGSFISPSLGITYKLGSDTVIRGSVSRGFTTPPLAYTSGGALFLSPNPSLEPEKICSYQTGIESGILSFLWIKFSLFHHSIKDILTPDPYGAGPPTYNDIIINGGKGRRQGFELETETVPFHNLSLSAGFTYTSISPARVEGTSNLHSIDVGFKYNDKESVHADLSGRYRWWDFKKTYKADYDNFIWDFNIGKKVMIFENIKPELFLTVHNIFDDAYYLSIDYMNPGRWMEAGIKFHF
jgi:vitamin B12 transporter